MLRVQADRWRPSTAPGCGPVIVVSSVYLSGFAHMSEAPKLPAGLDDPPRPFDLDGPADIGAWRIVLLDSVVPQQAGGRISVEMLTKLDEELGRARQRHAMVCLHHHPVAMHSRWLDNVGLSNANEFWSVIDSHPQVKAVVWGHVHQAFEGVRRGVRLIATPSTCAQFQPRSDQFVIDNQPPAYRLLTLHSNGAIDTGVHFLTAAESAA